MNVFELFAKLGIDTSEYENGLSGAEKKGHSFASSLSSGIGTAARVGAAAVAATTTAVIAGSAAFVNGVSNVAAYGDEIDKTSQRLGISTTAFQEWDYVMNIAGTDMQSMQMGMKTLTNQLDEARNGSESAIEKFEALGISMEDINNMSREEIFEQAIYGFQGMADSTERAALANDLFGRSGQELAPLFNMSAEETRELIETANEYGMVMSEEAVAASATFADSLTTLQGTMAGVKNNLLSEFLPSFSTVMDGLSAIFSGDEGGLELVRQGVEDFATQMKETLPRALEIGGDILGVLGNSIVENLPTIIDTAATVVDRLGTGLIENLPALLSAAVQIISRVASGLIENLPLIISAGMEIVAQLGQALIDNAPVVIPQVIGVITEITRTLTSPDNLSAMIEGGIQLLLAVSNGLLEALPDLIALIPEIIANIMVALAENYPLIVDSNIEFIQNLGAMMWETISNWLEQVFGVSLTDVISGLAGIGSAVADAAADLLSIGANLVANVISGVVNFFSNLGTNISNGMNAAKNVISNVLNSIKDTFSNIFEGAKNIVSGAIDFIKGLFDFEWHLPDIQLPHFSINGSFSLNPPSIPTISVDWYAKAMNNPMLLSDATIFGMSGNSLLGGGETGDEMIYGRSSLMRDIREAVGSAGAQTIVIPVYIGSEKIDELVVNSNQRNNFRSGGRG